MPRSRSIISNSELYPIDLIDLARYKRCMATTYDHAIGRFRTLLRLLRRPISCRVPPEVTTVGALLFLVGCTALLVGCRTYGSKEQLVTLTTDPPGATAYVMLYEVWLEHNRTDVLSNDNLLELHRIKTGVTPIKIELKPWQHVFVAEWGNHREYDRFTPKAGRVYTIARPHR